MPQTALIAEDDAITRTFIEMTMQRQGFVVTAVDSGEKALNQAQNDQYDVIITDIMMPGMEGIELIAALVEHAPSTKIIAISSEGMAGHTSFLKLAETVGASASIPKPVMPEILIETLSDIGLKVKR